MGVLEHSTEPGSILTIFAAVVVGEKMFGQGSNELIKWNVNLNPGICQTSAGGFNTEQASFCQGGGKSRRLVTEIWTC